MTEQEALTKWCPAVRITGESEKWHPMTNREVLVNPNSPPFEASRCIGAACMSWRWDDADSLDKPTRVHPNVLKDYWQGWTITDATPDAKGYVEISPPPPKLPHGYCGLAGKP